MGTMRSSKERIITTTREFKETEPLPYQGLWMGMEE